MLNLYRVFYFLIANLLKLIRPLLPNNLQQWILLRQKKTTLINIHKKRILFHAASGEIEYVKSVIRELKKTKPEIEVIVSYSSPSAENLFSNIKDSVTCFTPLPWDKPADIKHFLNHTNPSVIVFSRTDFWPELIHQARQKNIPLVAVSVAPRFGFLQNIWLKFNLSKMSELTVVNDSSCKKLKQFLNTKITTLSDTRFDQVMHRLEATSKFEIKSDHRIIVFGSTWPEDEAILLGCVQFILSTGYKIIWAPHDVSTERINTLKNKLQNYKYVFSSHLNSGYNFDSDILIIDQIGYLADMYRYSRIAFVGGSFKSKVHSVMEPLCANNYVIVGPYYSNNPEAIDFKNKGFVHSVTSATEMIFAFTHLTKNSDTLELQKQIQQNLGSTQKTLDIIWEQLSTTT